ncbi:MAG TPA: amidase [Candidatus Eisenbacteria bacterium]|nr:amidase [Candidatus Eisenbacteria bacterium]
MPDARLTRLTLAEAADLLRRGSLSPVELCEAALARVDAIDPELNSFTTRVRADVALVAAREAEREIAAGRHRGPLHGIPVGVKDLIDTAGLRTTYGSGIFRDYVPNRDGAVPARLREAGAVLLGKTATHEFGMGITTNNHFFGPTRNPWRREHVPGGSSGGAAAATAAELGTWQVGTDGGGSIRIPAAFCGVVGLKPTLGLISNRGQFGNGNVSFSVPGPIARTVRDAAIAAQALAGFDPEYAYARAGDPPDLLADLERGVRGLRVGTSPDLMPAPDPAVHAAYDGALDRLQALGAAIAEVRMPHHDLLFGVTFAVFAIEGGNQTRELIGDRPRVFSPEVERLMVDPPTDAGVWARAVRDRQWVAHDYTAAFRDVDVLVTPTAPCPAPRIDEDGGSHVFRVVPYTAAINMVGLPAVSIPMGMDRGLPLGLQIIGPHGADGLVLRVAHALEQDSPAHRVQRPPI